MLSNRGRKILVGTIAVVFLALVIWVTYASFYGTKPSTKAVATTAPVVQKSVGVELRGCGVGDAWLKNTNECSVLIRHVQSSLTRENFGERTDWMKEIMAGDSLLVNVGNTSRSTYPSYGLYISNMNGGVVGFLSGDCPPPVPKK